MPGKQFIYKKEWKKHETYYSGILFWRNGIDYIGPMVYII